MAGTMGPLWVGTVVPWLEGVCLLWALVPGAGLPGKGLPVLPAHCVRFVVETTLERNHTGDAAFEHLTPWTAGSSLWMLQLLESHATAFVPRG